MIFLGVSRAAASETGGVVAVGNCGDKVEKRRDWLATTRSEHRAVFCFHARIHVCWFVIVTLV